MHTEITEQHYLSGSVNNQLALDLIEQYKKEFSRNPAPEWAVDNKVHGGKITPSIPFVGRGYSKSKHKILIYASAENLTYYEKGSELVELLESNLSWDRRRHSLESKRDRTYPDVHIAPINNGGLLSSIAYICSFYGLIDVPSNPYDFIEMIAADNFCKYSIKTTDKQSNANIDYASDPEKLKFSTEYVKNDLMTLQPDLIFMPITTYQHVKSMVTELLPNVTIIPMYQLTSRVVNCHISRKISSTDIDNIKRTTPSNIRDWVEGVKITGMKQNGMYMFIADLIKRTEDALVTSNSNS